MAKQKNTGNSDTGKVGYKKPPEHTRFKPGKSGNPGGRPKKPKIYTVDDAKKSFLRHMLKQIPLSMNGNLMSVAVIEAVMYQAIMQAIKGDKKMIAFVLAEFFSHANAFEEAQVQQMSNYHQLKDIYFDKVQKFLESTGENSEEEVKQINYLEIMMDVYEEKLKENMDGSKKKKLIS